MNVTLLMVFTDINTNVVLAQHSGPNTGVNRVSFRIEATIFLDFWRYERVRHPIKHACTCLYFQILHVTLIFIGLTTFCMVTLVLLWAKQQKKVHHDKSVTAP